MHKETKRELLLRQLGLRHKLKVHDSVKQPETHEEIAANLLARWELEDEIAAIDAILADARREASTEKRSQIEKELGAGKPILKKKKP
jgi:hypothetical protein